MKLSTLTTVALYASFPDEGSCFVSVFQTSIGSGVRTEIGNGVRNNRHTIKHKQKYVRKRSKCHLFTEEQQLQFWITAFSTSHIGMSAVRDNIINACGEFAVKANVIDRGIKLPKFWPGDDFGKDEIFPDKDTAGRQFYRILYTAVSFATLGSAFVSYSNCDEAKIASLSEQNYILFFGIASLSFAASIASLFNASPMSLMPSFQKISDKEGNAGTGNIAGIQRNDAVKMEPKGLTRITRHPLILPVVPWGVATSFLAGGRTSDFVLFSGLSLYAIAGCACQDLRVIRNEGSVGTVMKADSNDVRTMLDMFYAKTSFVPFGAIFDGRQSAHDLFREFPIIPFMIGIPVGALIQDLLLQFLAAY